MVNLVLFEAARFYAIKKTPSSDRGFNIVEHPGGIGPPVIELQSIALPLGYGCSGKNYITEVGE